jgi:hypothetical protein
LWTYSPVKGLGGLLPGDCILFRGQLFSPFGLGFTDFLNLIRHFISLLVQHIMAGHPTASLLRYHAGVRPLLADYIDKLTVFSPETLN